MPIGGYYYEADRGAIPEYDNQWNNAGWEGWLTYHPADNPQRLDKPLAIVHSDAAAIPQGVRAFLQRLCRRCDHAVAGRCEPVRFLRQPGRCRAGGRYLWPSTSAPKRNSLVLCERGACCKAPRPEHADRTEEFRKMGLKFMTTFAAAGLVGGVALADQAEISRSITDIAAGADRHDWDRVRSAFSETVTTDYTSLWGGDPVTQPADELVAGWSGFLPGFDNTHHMVTNHTITSLDDTKATAEADFTATHRIDDQLWTLGGRYSYELEQFNDRWLVTSMTMTALWETGDRGLVGTAGERAAQNN